MKRFSSVLVLTFAIAGIVTCLHAGRSHAQVTGADAADAARAAADAAAQAVADVEAIKNADLASYARAEAAAADAMAAATAASAAADAAAAATTLAEALLYQVEAEVELAAAESALAAAMMYATMVAAAQRAIDARNAGNDTFVSRQAISGGSGTVTGSNTGAGKEAGEPDHAGNRGGVSVWWTWTAPATGDVTFDTVGSSFDTLLAVYTGNRVDALTRVASNDDTTGRQSEVTFAASGGVVYQIAVDGYSGAAGSIVLNWLQDADTGPFCDPSLVCGTAITCVDGLEYPTTCGPLNCDLPLGPCVSVGLPPAAGSDSFNSPTPISGSSGHSAGSNAGAGKEIGEPNHAGNAGGASVWWSWTAPMTGDVTFNTDDSDFDTLLAVYTGSSLTLLKAVASNDDTDGTLQSAVSFMARRGQTYHVAVDGYEGATGSVMLTWKAFQDGSSADDFASATAIDGSSGRSEDSNFGASREVGEPLHAGNAGGASVWWTWTARDKVNITFNTQGSDFDTLLAIYTGRSVSALTLVGSNDDAGGTLQSAVRFDAVEGRTYYIAVDGYGGATGDIVLNWRQESSAPTFATTFPSPTRSETVIVDGVRVEAAENEILVFLEEDVSSNEIADAEDAIAAQGGTIKSLNFALRTIQVGITDAIVEQTFINAMSERAGIAGSDVNELLNPDREFIVSNEEGFQIWLGKNDRIGADVPAPLPVSFPGDYWIQQIGAWEAWQVLSDPEVTLDPNTIGIVDTGIPSSQNVVDSTRIRRYSAEGRSIFGDDSPSSVSHGRNVTGYAAGYSNVSGAVRRGVDPHSDVVFVDVAGASGRAYTTDLLQGIKTAVDRGAKVVNFSWGDSSLCSNTRSERIPSRQRFRISLSGAVHYARQRDVLVVFSAGNNCEKHDDQLLRDVNDPNADSWRSHALIVGASTASRKDACFSRMGNVVNVMAPGEQVGYGAGASNGTSYAAPMVTGAAGLVRSIERTLSAEETRSIILRSAKRSVTFNTNAANIDLCTTSRRSVNMPGTATEPAGLLHVGAAVESALVADGVTLEVADRVALTRGQRDRVRIDVDVPTAGVSAIDVAFLIDQSGSYGDDIDTLQSRARDIVNSLASRDFDVQFGVAGFADFPQGSYGSTGDVPYRLYQGISFDVDAVIAAIERLDQPLMRGNDSPESQYEAVYRTVTEIGWRDGALRVLLLATDADFHDSDTNPSYPGKGRTAVLDILEDENVIVIGLQSGGNTRAQARLQELATHTGGSVWPLDAASSQIVSAIIDGIDEAVAELDVTLEVLAGESWVTDISPPIHEGVSGGETVSFTVSLQGQRSTSVEGLDYNVYLWARGDGAALLSRVRIPIRVPGE